MEIALWLLAGVIGGAGVWRTFTWGDRPHQRCPTPRAIAAWIAASPLGPFLFIVALGGLVGCISEWLSARPQKDSWWTRSICRTDHLG